MRGRSPRKSRRRNERQHSARRRDRECFSHAGILSDSLESPVTSHRPLVTSQATSTGASVDNLTHSLFGVTLARTPLGRAGRGTTAVLVIASNIPDIDVLTTARGTATYLHWHRGPTHGPIGIVFSVWRQRRSFGDGSDSPSREKQKGPPAASFWLLLAAAVVGALLHVLMDLPTSYGTRLLSPFDWHWFAVDWMPIVDAYLLVALASGTAVRPRLRGGGPAKRGDRAHVDGSQLRGPRRRAPSRARCRAARFRTDDCRPDAIRPRVPLPLSTAGRATAQRSTSDQPGKRCLVEIAAMPSFASPFKWRLIARLSNAYELQDIDLLDSRFSTDSRAPLARHVAAEHLDASGTSGGDDRRSARSSSVSRDSPPRARSSIRTGGAIVRFSDMRFAGGLFSLNQPQRGPDPFTVTIQLGPDGTLHNEQIGR